MIDGNFIYAQQPALAYQPGAWNVSDFAQLGHIVMGAIEEGPDARAREGLHPRLGSGGAEDGVAGAR